VRQIVLLRPTMVLLAEHPRLSSHSQVSLFRCAPILTAKDTRIAQASSTDVTNARRLENPVGPRRARQDLGQDHISIKKVPDCI